jgi:hypothetical protein
MTQRIAWYTLCGFVGLIGGVLSVEIVGAPLALLIPVFLVRFAKFHGLGGVATLLTYCATYGLLICWVASPALFPSSFATVEDPRGLIVFAGVLLLIDAIMASFALLPVVRTRAAAVQQDR